MKRLALVVLTIGLVSLNSFAKGVELSVEDMNTLMTKISEHHTTPADVVEDLANAEVMEQKCSTIGKSQLVICKTQIGVESDTEDMDSGFDSVYILETVHITPSMNLLRVSFIPLAG